MCRHLPDSGKLTLTNFHFTHYEWARIEAGVHQMWRRYMS
ncbi:hypothetical protein ACNKHM_27535 [Shigella sonnei]